MKYFQKIILKNGKEAILRNAVACDAKEVYEVFGRTHNETDFLLTYSDEREYDLDRQSKFLENKLASSNEVYIIAIVDDKVVATAGVDANGSKYKVKHRAEFGVSVLQEYWGLGIGKALVKACIECAKKVGYEQLELSVVADNDRAVALYKSLGFVEFGRNPKGFKSRFSGYQEVVLMLLEL